MNKKILWKLLCKYDNILGLELFCNSLSRIIQNKHDEDDLISLLKFNEDVEVKDLDLINNFQSLQEIIF